MQTYSNKDDLIFEISKRAELFINEFSDVSESDKDVYKIGVNRTPAQIRIPAWMVKFNSIVGE